ncbi:MAG: hypothetical protein ACPGYV_08025 [Phycisphaeraceae bacterium]
MWSRVLVCFVLSLAFGLSTGAHAEDKPAGDDAGVQATDKTRPLAIEAKPNADGKADADTAENEPKNQAQEQAEPELSTADLQKQIRELEMQVREKRERFREQIQKERAEATGNKTTPIDEIVLPKNPTREQAEAYVEALRQASHGRRSFSTNDPIVKKLLDLPKAHYDLIIAESTGRSSLRALAIYALRQIDPETIRKHFVSTLDENPNGIGVIVMHGWCEDVRPQIVEYVRSADSSMGIAWFQAAVELVEPELYPKLHEIAIDSRYAMQFINMLKTLPDYDVQHTINACWERAAAGKLAVSTSTLAPAAAKLGNVDALGVLIAQIQHRASYMATTSTYNVRRVQVLGLIEERGSNKELDQWYKANKDRLVFDGLSGRFVVAEDF